MGGNGTTSANPICHPKIMDRGVSSNGLARKVFSRPDMKMRAGRTQAVTKDITPSNDCRSRHKTTSSVSNERQQDSSSSNRSGVTDMVISMVLNWTPRKTMQVEGAQSFSGEESKSRIEKKFLEGLKRHSCLASRLSAAEIVDIIRTMKAKIAEHM